MAKRNIFREMCIRDRYQAAGNQDGIGGYTD